MNYPSPNLGNLPNEIVALILGNFSIKNRFSARQLNQKWRQMSFAGITELIVGSKPFHKTIMFSSRCQINFKSELQTIKVFELIMKERGNCMKSLEICLGLFDTVEEWIRILPIIPQLCPHVVRLSVTYWDLAFERLFLSLFQHYGRQLEFVFFKYNTFSDPCDFLIEHLNPDVLRELSLDKISQRNLEKIVDRFPLLSKLDLLSCKWEEQNQFRFDYLQKLKHLQDFFCGFVLTDHIFQTLMSSPIAKSLQRLVLEEKLCQSFPSSLELLHNLVSLRSLKICSLTCEQFLLCLDALKDLEHLEDFGFTLNVEKSGQKLLQNCFSAMGKLKNLKKLSFCIDMNLEETTDFSFLLFEPMHSVTNLLFEIRKPYFIQSDEESDELNSNFNCEVYYLFKAFPNLTNLSLDWESVSADALMECIKKLTKLQSLCVKDGSDQSQLQEFCHRKGISFQI